MDAEVVLRQKFHTYRQVQKTEKGRRLNKNEEALIKDAYKAGAVSILEALAAAKRIGPRVFLAILQGALFPTKKRHDTPMAKSPPRDRTKTRHACVSPGAAVSPPLLRWFSSMYPDAYILDVNGNPVAEPNLRAANIAKIYAENWQGEANSATGDDQRLALLKAGHWRLIEKTIRELADPPKSNQAIN